MAAGWRNGCGFAEVNAYSHAANLAARLLMESCALLAQRDWGRADRARSEASRLVQGLAERLDRAYAEVHGEACEACGDCGEPLFACTCEEWEAR